MKTIALQEYIEGTVRRTSLHPRLGADHPELRRTWALGLVGEAGEVADLVKKHIGHDHPLDRSKAVKELGDVCWCVTALSLVLRGEEYTHGIWGDAQEAVSLASASRLPIEHHAAMLCLSAAGVTGPLFSGNTALAGIGLESVCYSLVAIARCLEEPADIGEVWAANAAKLAARYPDGFDPKRSQARLAPKVYVASKFRNHLAVRAAQTALRAVGCSITYDWTPHVDHPEMEADQQACALADAKGVLDADALLLIRVPEMRGAYVEMGMALAKGIPVHIVQGDRGEVAAQVFEHHPLVRHHPTVEAAVAAIYSGATTRKAA